MPDDRLASGEQALIAPCCRNSCLRKFVEFHPVVTTYNSYNRAMVFGWDEAKNQANIRKHGVSFETARSIIGGPVPTWFDDRGDYGKVRHISIWVVDNVTVVVLAFTDRDGRIRLISARTASRNLQ